MARWDVDIDRAAIARIAQDPALAPYLNREGEAILAIFRRIAPVGPTKRFRDSGVLGRARPEAGRLTGYVGSSDFAAHIVEFGSVNNPPYRSLYKAARRRGHKVTD